MSRRVLLGQWPAGSVGSGFGLKIAKPAFDGSSADDANLLFSSDWATTLPVWKKGQFSATPGDTFLDYVTDLGLFYPGFIPFCQFLIQGIGYTGAFVHQFENKSFFYNGAAPMAYEAFNGTSYLSLYTTAVHIGAHYNRALIAGDPQGWPNSFTVSYAIFRVRAN